MNSTGLGHYLTSARADGIKSFADFCGIIQKNRLDKIKIFIQERFDGWWLQ